MTDNIEKVDVVGVNTATLEIMWVRGNLTPENAEAVINFAVLRQGAGDRFFAEVPHGKYKMGDTWRVEAKEVQLVG